MKAVLQRVAHAKVEVSGRVTGAVQQGFLVLLGVAQGDGPAQAKQMAEKIAGLRVFEDQAGKMNRSLLDIGGSVLLVSQFTLCADCRKGRRPSFTGAAPPEIAAPLYEQTGELLRQAGIPVQNGVFGADMQVSLVNDGPVTILLNTDDWPRP